MLVQLQGVGVGLAADVWEPSGSARGVVLFLHGGGQTRHSWRSAGPMLAEDGWLAYAIDARGHGDSEWAPDYSLDAMVADLCAVVPQLPEPPVMIGASMGGITSLIAEGEQPGLARALVLVDITPTVEQDGVLRIWDFMTSAPDGYESLEEVAAAVQAYQPQREQPVNHDSLRKNVRLKSDGRWHWHWDPAFVQPGTSFRMDRDRMVAAARRIAVPTLLVRGAQSDVVSTDGVDELLGLIPGSQAVEVGKAGHMVAGDDNAVFLEHVVDFLAPV